MNSAGMCILTILISLVIVAQSGWTAYAIENPNSSVNAAVIRSNANSGEGRSKDTLLHSSLRRLLETSEPTPVPVESTEESIEAVEEEVEEFMDEFMEENNVTNVTLPTEGADIDDIGEAGTPTDVSDDPYYVPGVENSTVIAIEPAGVDESNETTTYPSPEEGIDIVEPYPNVTAGDIDFNETAYPEEGDIMIEPEPAEPAGDGDLDEGDGGDNPDLDNLDPYGDFTDTTPTPSSTVSGEEFGGDAEGEPLLFEDTSSPTPIGGGEEGGTPVPTPGPYEKVIPPTYEPTVDSPKPTESKWGDSPWDSEPNYPTENPTPKPTFKYISKEGEDPLAEEEEPDVVDFSDDKIFYHGLGGKVGAYLDGVESPQDMEKDKNVQIIAGTLVGVFMVLLLVTAHMVMQYPDGLCAGCCRLTLKCICCITRTLCLPCRAICCKGSDQSNGRRTHAPMRTPFPTDLELA